MRSSESMLSAQDDDVHDERRTGAPETKTTAEGNTAGDGLDPDRNASPPEGTVAEGEAPGAGTYECYYCSHQVTIAAQQALPPCPQCGSLNSPSYYWPPP